MRQVFALDAIQFLNRVSQKITLKHKKKRNKKTTTMEESLQLQTFIASEMHRQLEKSNVKSCETSVALLCTAIYVAHRFLHFDSTQTWRQSVLYREPFQAWEMWPSPHSEKPVGSEIPPPPAEPMATDRFSCGESGPHFT